MMIERVVSPIVSMKKTGRMKPDEAITKIGI